MQSVAVAAPSWSHDCAQEAGHGALHWQDVGHHHHDEDSYHVDNSDESDSHMLADHVNFPGLLQAAPAPTPRRDRGVPDPQDARVGPHPLLDGPLRPPRLSA